LARNPAVALFVERAQAVLPDFTLTEQNAPAVAAICVRLDGLPLAIELAAARAKLFAPTALLARLHDRFALLRGGARDQPTRQQTLRNAIDWSYHLLTPAEQRLFRRLAVFVGGCTLEGAASVGKDRGSGMGHLTPDPRSPASPAPTPTLDALESLVDKNLLTQTDDGEELRFRMLETIREYALDRLEESGEADAIRQQHAHFFVELAEAAEPHLYGAGQQTWVTRLEVENDNLRSALAWAIEHARAIGLRLTGALGWFWHLHGHHREGRDWLLQALDRAKDAGVELDRWRAKALDQAGYLAMYLHDPPQPTVLLEQSVALWRKVGDPRGLAHALCDWGAAVQSSQGDLKLARVLLDESIAVFRQVGEQQGLVRALFWHGLTTSRQDDFVPARASAEESIVLGREVGDISNVAASMVGVLGYIAIRQGDYGAAHSFLEAGLRLMREVDDKPGIALSLGFLGSLFYRQGRYAEARPRFEESLRIWREMGSYSYSAWSLYTLGYVALRQYEGQHAAALLAESLALCRELGEAHGLARCLAGLAEVAQAAGELERAARLFGATAARLAASGRYLEDTLAEPSGRVPITSQAEFERQVAAVRAAMGDDAFAAAWAEGHALPLERAIAEAFGEV
jgi:predicted ATPase